MPDVSAFVDEVANELNTWPGVSIGRRGDGVALVTYDGIELGLCTRIAASPSCPVPSRTSASS